MRAVSGHGVSAECLERQFRESENFFALQLEDKLRIRVGRGPEPYQPWDLTALSPIVPGVPTWTLAGRADLSRDQYSFQGIGR